MHDFEYDVMQKRRIANQARYRKNGSKSKKCSLGIDYMTKKQWKERCGEVVSYNYNQPIEWKVFRTLPVNAQKEYIDYLNEKYHVNAIDLAGMFGVAPSTVRKMLDHVLHLHFPRGKHMSKQQRDAFTAYCNGTAVVDKENEETDALVIEESESANAQETTAVTELPKPNDPPTVEVEDAKQTGMRQPMNMSEFSFRFSGGFSRDMIANTLSMVLREGSNVQIDIRCVVGESAG